MQQLSSTALSVFRMYEWLLARRDRLPLPLASVRLLLSPSPGEVAAEPGIATAGASACTRALFSAEVRKWRTDAASHRDGMSLFYFAGHGVQRKRDDAVMLLEDFGNPDEGLPTNAVAIDNLFNGMAPPLASERMARWQVYFVDACRIALAEFRRSSG
jgi:hypothetical protein